MIRSTCQSCRDILRVNLRRKILVLQHLRYAHSSYAPIGIHHTRLRGRTGPWAVEKLIPNTSTLQHVLSHYVDTEAPYEALLHSANSWFTQYRARRLWTATEWRQFPESVIPEVAFVGRSNVGKSSLINKIVGHNVCYVGPRPGKTMEMRAYGITGAKLDGGAGPGGELHDKIALLDMPGYGYGSTDRWGAEILKYLETRRQLRRVYVLVNAKHGLMKQDLDMLRLLRSMAVPHQVIVTKVDTVAKTPLDLGKTPDLEDSESSVSKLSLLFAAIHSALHGPTGFKGHIGPSDVLLSGDFERSAFGARTTSHIAEIRWAILRATGHEELTHKPLAQLANKPLMNQARNLQPNQTSTQETSSPGNTESTQSSWQKSVEDAKSLMERTIATLQEQHLAVPDSPTGHLRSTGRSAVRSAPFNIMAHLDQTGRGSETNPTHSFLTSEMRRALSSVYEQPTEPAQSVLRSPVGNSQSSRTPSSTKPSSTSSTSSASSSSTSYSVVGGLEELEAMAHSSKSKPKRAQGIARKNQSARLPSRSSASSPGFSSPIGGQSELEATATDRKSKVKRRR